jgi:hypothetical protein
MKQFFTGPNVITIIVLAGFSVVTFLAMKPEATGVNKDVVLYLLGAWQSLAAAAVAYHIGSSAGSRDKDATIKSMSADAAVTATATAASTVAAADAANTAVRAATNNNVDSR